MTVRKGAYNLRDSVEGSPVCVVHACNRRRAKPTFKNFPPNTYERTVTGPRICPAPYVYVRSFCRSARPPGCPVPITAARLTGSSRSDQGRVEVEMDGQWLTVCNEWWNSISADVVCRILGRDAGEISPIEWPSAAPQNQPSGTSLFGSVVCMQHDSTYCELTRRVSCPSSTAAGVVCSGPGKGRCIPYLACTCSKRNHRSEQSVSVELCWHEGGGCWMGAGWPGCMLRCPPSAAIQQTVSD